MNCPPIDLHLNLHTQTIRPRGPVKYSPRRNFVLPRGGFHYFISAPADRGVNHVDSDCLKYRMQTLILCIFGRGVETHHACSFIFSRCRPSKWALIGRQPTEVPALREAGENLISPAPVAPDYQALSVPARPSVNVLICVFTPNLSIGVSEASRQLRARCLCAMRSIYETGSPFSLQMRGLFMVRVLVEQLLISIHTCYYTVVWHPAVMQDSVCWQLRIWYPLESFHFRQSVILNELQ